SEAASARHYTLSLHDALPISTNLDLLALPNVVVTPHLGASTDEAQEKAGVSVAKSVRLALDGELVPDAVNVAGGVISEDVRPGRSEEHTSELQSRVDIVCRLL